MRSETRSSLPPTDISYLAPLKSGRKGLKKSSIAAGSSLIDAVGDVFIVVVVSLVVVVVSLVLVVVPVDGISGLWV